MVHRFGRCDGNVTDALSTNRMATRLVFTKLVVSHEVTILLRELQDRYGSWVSKALLPATGATARICWPGKTAFDSDAGLYVGPDAVRWLWCKPPPGTANFPADFRIEGVTAAGVTEDGRRFDLARCAVSALSLACSVGATASINMLLRVEDAVLILPTNTIVAGPAEVHWVLTNALFSGDSLSPLPGGGQRADTVRFRSPTREWILRLLPTFGDVERIALLNGAVKQLPTAELVTTIASVAEVENAEVEAHAVTRLLSLATGSSVAGGARRIFQTERLVEEAFFEWPMFGGAESASTHALVINGGLLGGALTQFLNEACGQFLANDPVLAFTNAIGYLELARTSPVIEARIILCILALELLTYRLCLSLGRTVEQLAGKSIQEKLNTARGQLRMGFIDKRFAEDTRAAVRNPLMHSGVIPALTMPEKVRWAEELYALAFRMLLFLFGYQGKWLDPTNEWQPTVAPQPA